MNQEVEIIPIAIPLNSFNLHIANLVEHLLLIDQKMFPNDNASDVKEIA